MHGHQMEVRLPLDRTEKSDIWVMNADGSNKINLTNKPGDYWEPAWSPDGVRLPLYLLEQKKSLIYG